MSNIKVNIILVNYNTTKDTIECLESILKQTYVDLQVFIVDNSTEKASIDEFISWAKGEGESKILTSFPEYVLPISKKPLSFTYLTEKDLECSRSVIDEKVVFVKAKKNNGFASANNIALNYLKKIKGDAIYWLLNNDTVISKNATNSVVDFYLKNKSAGIIGTSLMEYSDKLKIQAIGGLYNPLTTKLNIPTAESEFCKSKLIKYPNGASMIISRRFLDEVGGLSEEYFLYFEELDWVLKGMERGYKPVFLRDEIVYHKGGASTGKNSELADYYYLRGKMLLTLKFFKKYKPIVFSLLFFAFPINRILRGQLNRVKILFKVLKDIKNN